MERSRGVATDDTSSAPTPVADDTQPFQGATEPYIPNAKEDREGFPFLDSPERHGDLGKFGPYQIVAVLGEGGMGCVFRARDLDLQREVALKVMHDHIGRSPGARERFQREARAVAALQDDHVVPVYHVGAHNGIPFIVLPLLQGETLERRLRRETVLTAAEVIRIGRETAEGLAAAHALQLVHRDIKPSNLWLEAPNGRVKILDFGLARQADESDRLTGTGLNAGTPAYMSPEHVDGKPLDGRTDLFSLGAVLYEAATGKRAFEGKTISQLLLQVTTHDPTAPNKLNPNLPAELSEYILRLLAKDPSGRPDSANDVRVAMESFASGNEPTVTWHNRETPGRPRRQSRRIQVGCTVTITMCLLIGIGLTISSWNWMPPTNITEIRQEEAQRKSSDQPLRIQSMEISHLETENGFSRPRGIIGKDSFQTRFGDRLTVRVHLSRPGYAYIIAARPDGQLELCFPEKEDQLPPLTDRPSYPFAERGVNYGLTDGTGLCVFVAVVSESPLPPFKEWLAERPAPPWKNNPSLPGVVWMDDGLFAEAIKPGSALRGERGKTDADPAQIATTKLADWMKGKSTNPIIAIGFAVDPPVSK